MRKITPREKYGLVLCGLVLLATLGYRFGSPTVKNWQSFGKEIKNLRKEIDKVDRLTAIEPAITKIGDNLKSQSGLPDIPDQTEVRSIIIKYLDENAKKSGIQTIDQFNAKPNPAKKREMISPEVKEAFISRLHAYELKSQTSKTEPETESETENESKPIFPPLPSNLPEEFKSQLINSISERGSLSQSAIAELVSEHLKSQSDGANVKDLENDLLKKIQAYQILVNKKKAELRKLLGEVDTSYDRTSFLITLSFKSEIEPLVKFIYNLENSSKWFKVDSLKISISDPKRTLLSAEMSLIATFL